MKVIRDANVTHTHTHCMTRHHWGVRGTYNMRSIRTSTVLTYYFLGVNPIHSLVGKFWSVLTCTAVTMEWSAARPHGPARCPARDDVWWSRSVNETTATLINSRGRRRPVTDTSPARPVTRSYCYQWATRTRTSRAVRAGPGRSSGFARPVGRMLG